MTGIEQTNTKNTSPDLPRKVGLWGAMAVMVGVVIGSGIFATPTTIAQNMGSPWFILASWLIGGLIALCGALTYAELATLFPESGGIYVYLREGFGECTAFVFGWTYMLITKPAAGGAIVFVFAEHFQSLTGLHWNAPLLTCITLFILTLINVLGVRGSTRFAILLTSLKYLAIGAIIVLGLFIALRNLFIGSDHTAHFVSTIAPVSFFKSIVPVMAAIMWTYDGWSDVGSISGEVKNPSRTLPRVYIFGTLGVIALYMLANAVYLWHIPLDEMRTTDTVAPLLLNKLVGPAGAAVVTALIILSTLGCSHVSILTGARVTFAQARDGLLFRFLGKVNTRYETPAIALWTQLLLDCVMVLALRNFQSLADSFVFTMWIFYGMAAMSVFILRRKYKQQNRPFKVPGYPYVPAIFILTSFIMTILSIQDDWKTCTRWLLILTAGIPTYYLWRKFFPTPVKPDSKALPGINTPCGQKPTGASGQTGPSTKSTYAS